MTAYRVQAGDLHDQAATGAAAVSDGQSEIADLKGRERTLLDKLEVYRPAVRPGGITGATVVLIGAGAVNLIVALELVREGASVKILEARADPRGGADWEKFGATFGGNDGRIFSLTEARQHHVRDGSALGSSAYNRHFDAAGWLCCPPDFLDAAGRAWIDAHERIPGWLLKHYGDSVLSFNVESAGIWESIKAAHPELFDSAFSCDRLVRIYPSREIMERAKAVEESLGATATPIPLEELGAQLPALTEAVERDEIGGALAVVGFSVNNYEFGRRLIDLLEGRGVVFAWEAPVSAILRSSRGVVKAVQVDSEEVVADNYVLSPGAYGSDLLAGLQSDGSIASVVGAWVAIPNSEPKLHVPLKISRRGFGAPGAAEGANVIPGKDAEGRDVLFISSGHGYLGIRPTIFSQELVDRLTQAPRETAQRYFPDKYAAAERIGFDLDERHCIRPWTPTGLGILETAPTAAGGAMVVATGHNTGGFSQGPAIAKAVVATLSGRSHRMQTLYHPSRCQNFLAALHGRVAKPQDTIRQPRAGST